MFLESAHSTIGTRGPLRRSEAPSPSAFYVHAMVRSAFGVCDASTRGRRRGSPREVLARQVAIYLMHTHLGSSLTEAGRFYRRDRTTAAHACRVVELRREAIAMDICVEWLEGALRTWLAADVGGRT